MDIAVMIIQNTMVYAAPLLIVALAGCFAEKSGIINLALEGGMIFGSFIGAIFVWAVQKAGVFITPGLVEGQTDGLQQLMFFLALLISGIAGAIFSLLLSTASIRFKCDQTIIGTALNLLAPALLLAFSLVIFNQEKIVCSPMPKYAIVTKQAGDATQFYEIFTNKIYISNYICIALFIILSIWLYKSKTGTHLRACGEHPQAAASVGINVFKMRYLGTTISGFLAGLGGYAYIATVAAGTAESSVGGKGFLALAIMIFGNWSSLGIILGAFLFGLLSGVGPIANQIPFLEVLHLPIYFYNIIPFLFVIIILILTRKKSGCPKAEGIPYEKGMR